MTAPLSGQEADDLQCSAFFIVQLSPLYMTTGKTRALTIRTFVGKVLSVLFNTLFRFVIVFLPKSKHLLISWLQLPSAAIWEPKKTVCHCFHCFLIYLPWSDGTGCHKEGWVLKNWCFGTVVLEKTFESSFNCKEIKPANPKGNWPWIFSGMTNAEVEAPLLWPPDAGSQLFGKDPDPGRDWRQEEKGTTED